MTDPIDLDALLAFSPLPPSSPLTELPIHSSSTEPAEEDHDRPISSSSADHTAHPKTPDARHTEDAEPPVCANAEELDPDDDSTTPPPLPHTPRSLQIADMGSEGVFIGADSNDPGVQDTSPLTKANARRKREAKRQLTIGKQNAQRAQAHEERLREEVCAEVEARKVDDVAAINAKTQCFHNVLQLLEANETTWGDLVKWISRPTSGMAQQRFDGLFKNRDRRTGESQVQRVLDLWSTRNSSTGRADVHAWAIRYASRVVSREANAVTWNGVLLTRRQPFMGEFLLAFNFSSIHERLQKLCPSMTTLLRAFTTTTRQRRANALNNQSPEDEARTARREARKDRRIGFAMANLLGERSQNNSLMKHVLGVYMYVTGASRQLISVLSSIGDCSGYITIAGSGVQDRAAGKTIAELSDESEDEDPDWLPDSSESDEPDDESSQGDIEEEPIVEDGDPESQEADARILESQRHGGSEMDEPQGHDGSGARSTTNAIEDTIGRAPNAVPPILNLLVRGAGLLKRLSESCHFSTRACAIDFVLGHVYDNINMMFKVAEQILGRKDTQENGTCATVFPLHEASPKDMQTADLLASFDSATPLTMQDILHTPAEAALFHQSLEHALLRTIVNSSDLFARFRSDVDACLPAMNIDESSTTGNAEVLDTIFAELEYEKQNPSFAEIVALVFGDQLSIARLRTIIANRAGHEKLKQSYGQVVFGPGFFHHQMAVVHGIMETHFGDPTAGHRNPASLCFFNTLLDRKPIVLSSLPPYRTCRDLIFTTLSASALHCLELVSGCQSLGDYAANVTFDKLREHVAQILKMYASPNAVAELRLARQEEISEGARAHATANKTNPSAPAFDPFSKPLKSGDMVFENASLFLHDALVFREFTDAIKGGYSGRIIRTLKILTLMYRGSGRAKYAHECLHLVHNLMRVWPGPLRAIMIKNWLVNPTGKDNAWVPVDLLQEHMNFWVKVIYKAQGSNASWDWLQNVSPCISVFRQLAAQVNETLGQQLGTKHHSPDLTRDLASLATSMRDNGIYRVDPGRILRDMKNSEAPNVISSGLKQLPTPLSEYNKAFEQLQRRRREMPLVTPPSSPDTSPPSTPAAMSPDTALSQPTGVALPETLSAGGTSDGQHGTAMLRTQWAEEDEEDYWKFYDADEYEPRTAFAEEEEPSLDLDDW